jgi:hypothetical protein
MKKSYLIFAGLAATFSSYAQGNLTNYTEAINKGLVTVEKPGTNQILNEKSGVVFWSDDFSDPNTWTIDNDTVGLGAEFGWSIDSNNDGWFFTNPINSTSGGNYAELSNGDAQAGTQLSNMTYTMTTANPIDVLALAGTEQVSLSFLQYGALFNDLQEILISVNGVTFTPVGDNSDKDVLSSSGGAAYDNPDNKLINLAPYIAGFGSSVWIQFRWTTAFPNSASNPNVWITYGWMIDDVELVTNPSNDITINSYNFGSAGLPYYQIPVAQIAPIDFSAQVTNNGALDQPGSMLSVDVTGTSSYNGTSATTTIAVGSTDSLFTTTQFTPSSTIGSSDIALSISSDSTDLYGDDNPNDNSATETIEITDYLYARDMGVADGGSYNVGEAFEVGPYFDIFADQTLKAIDVTISNSSEPGAIIYGVIYSVDAATGDFIFEGNTDDYQLTSSDVSSGATITLPLFSPFTVLTGRGYLVVAGAYGDAGATNDLVVATSGNSEPQTCFYYDGTDLTWYYTTGTPMVRMNFDQTINIQERLETKISLGQNMPNPFSNNTIIEFELDKQMDIEFEVLDITGKVVKNLSLGTTGAGTHQINLNSDSFRNGIYYYSIKSAEFKVTKKMIIQK